MNLFYKMELLRCYRLFKKFNNNHSMSQSQQQASDNIYEEEIRLSIHLAYVEGTSERLRRKLRSRKMRITLCTESTLHKLLCKP